MYTNHEEHTIADSKETHVKSTSTVARNNILTLMENFIEQILKIRRTVLGVSISALIISPIAIGLSILMIGHPT